MAADKAQQDIIAKVTRSIATSPQTFIDTTDTIINRHKTKQISTPKVTVAALKRGIKTARVANETKPYDQNDVAEVVRKALLADLRSGRRSKTLPYFKQFEGTAVTVYTRTKPHTEAEGKKILGMLTHEHRKGSWAYTDFDVADNENYPMPLRGKAEPKAGVSHDIEYTIYKAKDPKLFVETMQSFKPTNAYALSTPQGYDNDNIPLYNWAYDIATACNLKTDTPPISIIDATKNRRFGLEVQIIIDFATDVLAHIAMEAQKKDIQGVTPNVLAGHDIAPRTAMMTLAELFATAILDAPRLDQFFVHFRTPEALREARGFKASMESPRQLSLIFNASNDYKTTQELIRLNTPILMQVLVCLLSQATDKGKIPITTEQRNDKLSKLAKPMYAEQIAKRGKLDTDKKLAYYDNLRFLEAIKFKYYVAPNKYGGNHYKEFRIINITHSDTNKKGHAVAIDWQFTPEFVELAPHLIWQIADGYVVLKSEYAIMLASQIDGESVKSEKATTDTVFNGVRTYNARKLLAWTGRDAKNTTDLYKGVEGDLKELQDNGIIDKFTVDTPDGKLRSMGRGKAPNVTIYYPQSKRDGYITKQMRAQQQQLEIKTQNAWRADLNKLDTKYRHELKADDWRKYLAEDLKLPINELQSMLTTPPKGKAPIVPITPELHARILELLD